jgi:hypothetical protein
VKQSLSDNCHPVKVSEVLRFYDKSHASEGTIRGILSCVRGQAVTTFTALWRTPMASWEVCEHFELQRHQIQPELTLGLVLQVILRRCTMCWSDTHCLVPARCRYTLSILIFGYKELWFATWDLVGLGICTYRWQWFVQCGASNGTVEYFQSLYIWFTAPNLESISISPSWHPMAHVISG